MKLPGGFCRVSSEEAVSMSLLALSFTLFFVIAAMVLSMWQKLGVERDLLIAAIRASVQLLLVGYILKAIFALQGNAFTFLMVLLMTVVATLNIRKRGQGLSGVGWKLFAAIAFSETLILGFLLLAKIVPPTPQYVIPISGMIIGNSMVVAGLFLNRLRSDAIARRAEILLLLSLGATPKQSVQHVLKQSVRASMIPTIDSTKTTGLVQLPGMMTGQIIAGADPIQAVRYQLLILFAIMAAAALTSVALALLLYPSLFNAYQQPVLMHADN
jgi:putative ABC transport system permease protein